MPHADVLPLNVRRVHVRSLVCSSPHLLHGGDVAHAPAERVGAPALLREEEFAREIVVRVQLVEIAGPVRLAEVFSGRRREEVDVGGPRSAAVLPHFKA